MDQELSEDDARKNRQSDLHRKWDNRYAQLESEWDAKWRERALERTRAEFKIAEEWANKPNLTASEIAHGVAWGLRNHRDQERERHSQYLQDTDRPTNEVRFDLRAAYCLVYDELKADEIKSGLVRSAADLFT